MEAIGLIEHSLVIPGLLRWPELRAGKSAVHPLEGEMTVPRGASVPLATHQPSGWPFTHMPRALSLAIRAVERLAFDPDRSYGLVLGLANLFSETDYLEYTMQFRDQAEKMTQMLGYSYDYPLNFLARAIGRTGPQLRLDSACATGNDALIAAHQWLATGEVRDVIVVAASAMLNPMGLALFHNIKALNDLDDPEASCPFDARRRGFVMGEGAAAVWLSADKALPAQGYMVGYGQSMNADKFVDLPSDLSAMAHACRQALGPVEQPAYISAHGTATRANDSAETRLYHQLFGNKARDIPISSIKSMIGHCLGAAALIEGIVCVEALKSGWAPPTINLNQADPECNLNYVPHQAQPITGRFALSNAFAFGGQNSCVLFSGTPS